MKAVLSRLANMPLALRFGLGFAMLMVLLAVIMVLSLATMVSMQGRTDTILKDKYRSAVLAGDVKYNVAVVHQLLRSAIIAAEYQGERAVQRQIVPLRQKNAALLAVSILAGKRAHRGFSAQRRAAIRVLGAVQQRRHLVHRQSGRIGAVLADVGDAAPGRRRQRPHPDHGAWHCGTGAGRGRLLRGGTLAGAPAGW